MSAGSGEEFVLLGIPDVNGSWAAIGPGENAP